MARSSYIIESGKRITWKETSKGIDFSDGKSSLPNPSNMDAKLAYKGATGVVVPPIVVPPVIMPPVVVNPPTGLKMISWKDFCVLKDVQGEKLGVVGGDYRGRGQARPENLQDVYVDFSGCQFGDKNGVTVEMIGVHNNVTFNGGLNTNGSQRFIQYKPEDKVVSKNITIQNAVSDDGGSWFGNNGNLDPSKGMVGVIQGLKVINNIARNCPTVSQLVYAYAVEDAEIYGNVMSNINHGLTNDTGLIVILGNGRIHSNKAVDYQGHLARTQPMQILSTGKTLDMYNNASMLTDKYGMFDVQVMGYYSDNKLFRPADVNVYNNTGGKYNTSNDWDAMFVDLYNFYGKLGYWNNLGFEMKKVVGGKVGTVGITDMINYNYAANFSRNENNKYFNTYEEAMAYKKANPSIGSSLTL